MASLLFQEVSNPAQDIFGATSNNNKRLAILGRFNPYRATGVSPVLDAVRLSPQGNDSARFAGNDGVEFLEPLGDPAAMAMSEFGCLRHAAAHWHRKRNFMLCRTRPKRVTPCLGATLEDYAKRAVAVSDFDMGWKRCFASGGEQGNHTAIVPWVSCFVTPKRYA